MKFLIWLVIFSCVLLKAQVKDSQLESFIQIKAKAKNRYMYVNRQTTLTITVENSSTTTVQATILYKIPEELEYTSSNPQGKYQEKAEMITVDGYSYKKTKNTLRWNLAIPRKSIVEMKVVVRGIECAARTVSVFQVSYLGFQKQCSVGVRIEGCISLHLSTYDTKDPCVFDTNTIYIITARNEANSTIRNIKLTNDIPSEMKFIRAEIKDSKNRPMAKVKYFYNKEKHQVYFDAIAVLQAGKKITYKIECKALSEGNAKNTARIKYNTFDRYNKEIIDEEGTVVTKD